MSPGSTPFRRISPHPGMMINVDIWRDAHEYHREQLDLHHLALHGWGVVQGLDVQLVDGADNTLRVDAGLAIDSAGRFIIVPQSQTYQITARERRTVYLVLQFRDVLADPSGNDPTRVVEAYRIQERDRLPEEPYIELARVEFDPRAGKVTAPKDPEHPASNEVDLRARTYVGAQSAGRRAPRVQIVAQTDADGLAPRLDDLGQRVGALGEQVRVLMTQVEAVGHAPAPTETTGRATPAAGSTAAPVATPDTDTPNGLPHDDRIESLAVQVQQLNARVEAFAFLRSHTPEALDAQTTLTNEQVSATISEHVSAISQRFDAVAQEVATVSQRTGSDLATFGARVDGMRNEVDALGLQLQALSRQMDAFAMPAPAVIAPPVVSTTERRKLHLGLAEHGSAGWDAHREGLRLLAREIEAQPDLSGEMADRVRLTDAYALELLYMSGSTALSLSDLDVEAIGRLLEQGTTVVGEGCATGPGGEAGAREFAMSFVELANRLGRQLTRVDRHHPLMRARYVFGELPTGARPTARVLEAGGLVYSDSDYGCTWQGGSADHPLPRSTIRDAVEFGLNLAMFRRPG